MILRLITVSFVVLLLAGGTALGEIYKWVDDDGVVSFKDYPPPATKKSRKVKVYTDDDFQSSPPPQPQKTNKARKGSKTAVQKSNKEPFVELYTTEWCPYCKQAIEYLRKNGIQFVEYDIEKDDAARKRKDALDKRPGVPFALINGNPVHGFYSLGYDSALKWPWKE